MVSLSVVIIFFILYVCFLLQCDAENSKRILTSDPNDVHSLELSVQDIKQKYELSTTNLAAELGDQRNLITQLASNLDSAMSLISKLEKQLNDSQSTISQLTSEVSWLKQTERGVTYIRWGRDNCPDNSTELVYSGYAGGSWFDHSGGAANYICLPSDPQNYPNDTSSDGYGRVYGAEYQRYFGGSATQNDDVPCCVCRPATSSIVMIPGRTSCYPGWNTEYQGYLAAGYFADRAASEYVCMDNHPEVLPYGKANKNGALFYDVAAECGSLPCPPYSQGHKMACVVCSK